MKSYITNAKDTIVTLEKTIGDEIFANKVVKIAQFIKKIDSENKFVAIFGNGGSASDSQHFAAELVCTYEDRMRKPFKALALTTDSSILTAWSNDYTFDTVFERQIDAYNESIGLAFGLSTSGKSQNILFELKKAHKLGIKTCLVCGNNDLTYKYVDYVFKIPNNCTATIQTITQIIYHSICSELENHEISTYEKQHP